MSEFKNSKTFRIIISILVAVVMWLYVDNIDTTPVEQRVNDVPIRFIGAEDVLMERGLMMASSSVTSVDLVLSGSRNIMTKLNTEEIYVSVDLTSITAPEEYSLTYEIVFPDTFSQNNGIELTSASTYRVTVEIVELYSKSVMVRGTTTGSTADGYMVGEMSFDTDTILVSGEQLAVSNISHALVTVNLDGATENIITSVDFQLIDFNGNVVDKEQFRTDVDTVRVTVPILQIKELPLVVDFVQSPGSSLGDIVQYSINPSSVTVAGSQNSLAGLEEITLAEIDLSEVTEDTTFTVPIPLPSGAQNLSGETEAEITITFQNVSTQTYTVDDISVINGPENVQILTNEMEITLRGPVDVLAEISAYQIRVVGDMSGIAGGSGSYAVPATVYVDGTEEAGAIGTYQITVQITS